MAQRMQSPSSINTFKQCPRKYYYRYIERRPTKPSIHLVRGTVAHSALEYFFEEPLPQTGGGWKTNLQLHGLQLLERFWDEHQEEFAQLDETPQELVAYKEETKRMILTWVQQFSARIEDFLEDMSFEDAFALLTPQREAEYKDQELNVRGYIDAIEKVHDNVELIDYKTSKKPEITDAYRLQLGIYALLYLKRHSKVPDGVGIHFLRHEKQVMQVNDELLLDAQFEIEQVHMLTQTRDIRDYPKKPSPLCNWCDYYELCFGKK